MHGPEWARASVHRNPYDRWTRANLGEILPDVVPPFAWTMSWHQEPWRAIFDAGPLRAQVRRTDFVRLYFGRAYLNVGAIYHFACRELGLPSGPFLATLGGPALGLPELPLRLGMVVRRLPTLLALAHRHLVAPARAARLLEEVHEVVAALAVSPLESWEEGELLAWLARARDLARRSGPPFLLANALAFGQFGLLAYLCERWAGDAALAGDLVAGGEGIRTTEANLELWRLARWAAQSPALAQRIVSASATRLLEAVEEEGKRGRLLASLLRDYLARYGHRGPQELDISAPRWAEDPGPLWAIFQGYVQAGSHAGPVSLAERRRQALARLRGLPWPKRLTILAVARRTRALMPLRENPKFEMLRLSMAVRRLALAIGRRLVQQGTVEREGDVFMLTLPEVEGLLLGRLQLDARAVVARRGEEMERWRRQAPPPVLGPDGEPLVVAVPSEGRVLRGRPASAGVATGPARILYGLHQAHEMRPGDILVAPATDPAWTVLFPLARALVTELGGVLSHGAILARELGIPAVVNVEGATRVIRSGQVVTVDGTQGLVTLEEASGSGP